MKRSVNTQTVIHAALVTLASLLLYTLTLAPTVLWGDDAELQRLAVLNQPGVSFRTYRLWIAVTHIFTELPFGDPAWRVNFATACYAALTIGLVFTILRVLNCSIVDSWAGSAALAISHTFWLHAVRTEVYSFFLLLMAAALLQLLAWNRNPARWWLLFTGLFVVGVSFHAHLLIVTLLPALMVLIAGTRPRSPAVVYVLALAAVTAGYLLLGPAGESTTVLSSVGSVIAGLLSLGARDLALWVGFLGYQFMLLAPLGIVGLFYHWKVERLLFWVLLLAFGGNVLFVLSFHVIDQYVFYLPSYLVFALWIGVGLQSARTHIPHRPKRLSTAVVVALLFAVVVYRLVPQALNQLRFSPVSVRTLPYRDNNLFFLYPPKNGYDGARQFGVAVMEILPLDAALLVDHLPQQTLLYLQAVESIRSDIIMTSTDVSSGQLNWLLEQSESRPVFLADDESYYDMVHIADWFDIIPFGLIYRLERKTQPLACSQTMLPCPVHAIIASGFAGAGETWVQYAAINCSLHRARSGCTLAQGKFR